MKPNIHAMLGGDPALSSSDKSLITGQQQWPSLERTRHGAQRQQQRAIPSLVIDLIMAYGVAKATGNGATKYYLDKRAHKRLGRYAGPIATMLSPHLNCFIVVDADGRLITAAHRTERIRH